MLTLLFNALAVLFAASSAPLSFGGAADSAVLVQAGVASPLALLGSADASALAQAGASATFVLQSSQTANALDQAAESTPLVLASSSGTTVLAQASGDSLLMLLGSADAFDTERTADADALLALSTSGAIGEVAGGVFQPQWLERGFSIPRGLSLKDGKRNHYPEPAPAPAPAPALGARGAAWLKLLGTSNASVSSGAASGGTLALRTKAVSELGLDPADDEELLLVALAESAW